ncbi:transmembrane emp24 domain-containing protein 5 [Hydra vulgaris]|uniref:transmembrane emp24 domain-containing protein 5 n=1 Tax=Hydra vulgaris TaxID=6087 RepID=UPI0001926904|nr:transmembrane emp24 domain-containing protein 5 [Hydra vulgaris]
MKVYLIFYFVAAILCEIEDGVQYIVGAGKMDCFYRKLSKGDMMDFDLQVLSGGEIDITLVIRSMITGREYLNEFRQTEVSKEINIEEDGPVEICFDNRYSKFWDKVIYFDLGIDESENKTGLDHEELFKGLHLEKDGYDNNNVIMVKLESIGLKFETIEQFQLIFRSRYKRHRSLQEHNQWLVTWFSSMSCILMIVVGILQVFLIRNLFKSKQQKGMHSGL